VSGVRLRHGVGHSMDVKPAERSRSSPKHALAESDHEFGRERDSLPHEGQTRCDTAEPVTSGVQGRRLLFDVT
jgi:hypothetical protein